MDATTSTDRVLAALGAATGQSADLPYLSPILRTAAGYLDAFQALESALTAAHEIYALSRVEGDESSAIISAGETAILVVLGGNGEQERTLRMEDLEEAKKQTENYVELFRSILKESLGGIPAPYDRRDEVTGRASAVVFEGPRERVESALLTCIHVIGEAEKRSIYEEAMQFLREHDELVDSPALLNQFIPASQGTRNAEAYLYGIASAMERDIERSK